MRVLSLVSVKLYSTVVVPSSSLGVGVGVVEVESLLEELDDVAVLSTALVADASVVVVAL